jgi:hypothetical protein
MRKQHPEPPGFLTCRKPMSTDIYRLDAMDKHDEDEVRAFWNRHAGIAQASAMKKARHATGCALPAVKFCW